MKQTISPKMKTCALIDSTNGVLSRLVGDFVKYHTGNGHLEICKESENFTITMRLERKEEVK